MIGLENKRVVVAMSGGVDSSVAAALLVQQGYQVIGMMMRLWSEDEQEAANRCCTPDAMAQARRVAAILGIPFYAVDARDIFRQTVVQAFIYGYTQGQTPNPCLVCNRVVRWSFLLDHAIALGAHAMATGHYVRIINDSSGKFQLRRSVDLLKDQSYVLHMLRQDQLARALFPLGDYRKQEVRQLAREFGLPVSERQDSQDLCFLGNDNYKNFLTRHAPQVQAPGPILTQKGEKLGDHAGLAFYTIGQRKGLRIASHKPLYVIAKDLDHNALIVGEKDELGKRDLQTKSINWISGDMPTEPFRAQIQIRYRTNPAWGLVKPQPAQRLHILFDHSLPDITPGQAAVIYDGQTCLGGGTIA